MRDDASDAGSEDSGGMEPPEYPSPPPEPKKKKRKKKRKKFYLGGNWFSQLFFVWVSDLVKLCRRVEDIRSIHFSLSPRDTSKETGDLLEQHWNEQLKRDRPSLLRAIWRAFGKTYAKLALFKAVWAGCIWFVAYWLLGWLIEYRTNSESEPLWLGHILALSMFVCSLLSVLSFHQLTLQCTRIGIQCRAALMVLIYRKSLKLSFVKGGVGDIVNLISNECNRIAEASVNAHFFWAAFFEAAVLLSFLMRDFTIAALPVIFLVLVFFLPLQYFLAKRASNLSCNLTLLITKRVHVISEILTTIKLVKFYAWEDYYRQKILNIREKEIKEARKELYTKVYSLAVVFVAPVTCTLVVLATNYALYPDVTLTPRIIFCCISLFDTLRYPLLLLPNAERSIAGALSSIVNLEEFFLLPEIDDIPKNTSQDENLLLSIKNADFIWDGDLDHPHIYDLNLELKRNTMIGVVGDLGSGRSLLAAIMGQIKRTKGEVTSYGPRFGYVPQEPWLLNASSLRDNIIFGIDVDEKKYADAVRVSGLTRDFLLLSNGDDTFVNEINLSPSQKQRISLARCIYHDPDIILIEDCLADFDYNHAKRLFNECLKNYMKKGRCVILLTQQKNFLADCDEILVFKSGRMLERGTYKELKQKQVNFSAWVTDIVPMDDDPTGVLDKVSELRLDPTIPTPTKLSPLKGKVAGQGPLAHLQLRPKQRSSPLAQQVINAEKTITDPEDAIKQLIKMNAGSMQNTELNEETISKMIEKNQQSILTGQSSRPPTNFANQDIVTRTIQANQLTIHSIQGFDLATMEPVEYDPTTIKKWVPYYQYLTEATPVWLAFFALFGYLFVHGVRFFSDFWLEFLADRTFGLTTAQYLYVYGGLCVAIAVLVLSRGYLFASGILRRNISLHNRILDVVLAAPMAFYDITPLGHILSHFAKHLFLIDEFLPEAALQVLSFFSIILGTLIIVFAVIPWMLVTIPFYALLLWLWIPSCVSIASKFQQLEASNKSPMFAHLSTTLEGLFSIRLYDVQDRFDMFNRTLIDADHKALFSMLAVKTYMAFLFEVVVCCFIYLTAEFIVVFKISPSNTGLAISNALQLLVFVQWFLKMSLELNASMESVSALLYFANHVPKESKYEGKKPPIGWPSSGEIEFRNITLKYHRYGVAVLKNVSFHIKPREKIAIVGRSGSGKTTILMSLLRIVEAAEGSIHIDGLDISRLSLKHLRTNIAVIPQEPILLTGTIRSNLDPLNLCSDDEIWKALRAVHLGEKIQEMDSRLDTVITENGKTFSVSERQLFCIARAILIKSPIVVLDEPVTLMDKDTEALIQTVLRENFSDRTIIVLASRYRLIVQMDRVIVMDHGYVVEFDTPLSLLNDPKSKFSLMIAQSGDLDISKLKSLALAYQRKSAIPKSLESVFDIGRDSTASR